MKSNFDNEMKDIVAKMHEIELESIPQNEELKGRYELSDIFYGKMQWLIRKVDRKNKLSTAVKYAAATAAVLVLALGIMNPGMVTKASEELIRQMSDHMNFKFKGNLDIAEIPEYEAGYVPEGYVLVESDYDELAGLLVYRNGNSFFTIVYGRADGSLNIDNKDKTYQIIKLKDGTEIHYLKSKNGEDSSSMTWLSEDKTIVFSLIAPFTEEELLKIKENIRKK